MFEQNQNHIDALLACACACACAWRSLSVLIYSVQIFADLNSAIAAAYAGRFITLAPRAWAGRSERRLQWPWRRVLCGAAVVLVAKLVTFGEDCQKARGIDDPGSPNES